MTDTNTDNPKGLKRPAVSKAMKEFWSDPERVAAWKVKHAKHMEARRADPDKLWSRRGIPNGFTRAEADKMNAAAAASATATIEAMCNAGEFDYDPPDDAKAAQAAMHELLTIMRSSYNARTRLRAARCVLMYTCAKPKGMRAVTLDGVEELLKQFKPLMDAE